MNDNQPHDDPITDADDARLAAQLRLIEADQAPPDSRALAELRERTLAVFAQAATASSAVDDSNHAPVAIPFVPLSSKRWRSRVVRGAIAVFATAAAVIVAAFFLGRGSYIQAAPFAEVLAGLRAAHSLQLRVTHDGHSADVWVRAPGLVRYEDSPEHYRIAAGSRLWKIDQTTNTATAGDSPWFVNPQEQVNLLALLDVGVEDARPLLAVRPSGRAQYAQRDCLVYRVELPAKAGPLQVEAFADEHDEQLLGIVARAAGAPPDAPPLAELTLVAVNPTVDEALFTVARSLTEDGRIGKIVDAQGVVVLRPMLAQRWTPIARDTLLSPGDWLRTDLRGANAVRARLSSDVELTLGPGTLIECISPAQCRIHSGEVQVNSPMAASDAAPQKPTGAFELLAPRSGSEKFASAGNQLWRVGRNETLVKADKVPRWLAGFEGTTNNESLGSLLVKLPDGRNEPLSVGEHKVSVEIRDQIARTTIEETFVNHTDQQLEGVFHFPLPQDASISGFGMWIGGQLIEADVVERERAREIFETILREKRDPGLLEWTSGNLFKARVFPIEAHAEKRVKIVYTQVLPLRANRYRYTYGLRSDLLRTRPVRELSLSVEISSALPIKQVTCPTHPVRTQQTAHAAQVEFAAQEYTPDRDFEVVCEIDGRNSDVVVVPHRRGDDGYFLLQITPPAREGNWQRELLPDGAPLTLVLLCDTSASMDEEKRRQQAEFVASTLASLGPKDRFLLAAADVETVWATPEPVAALPEAIDQARDFIAKRTSLGWTNLAAAYPQVLKKSPPGAQIIYVGDGILAGGVSDPVTFVAGLGRAWAESNAAGEASRALHTVTVGNTSDTLVMEGIATVGRGSSRAISGERTPQIVALELLNEIAQPGLRDLKIEFRGLTVAAVYPGKLPTLSAGTQQILTGRYLPTGNDQHGEVIVSGTLAGQPVRYAARVDLADAEQGNSFIPRLWARSHLDHLLRQGGSQSIRDEIIELSERFHIITPYTSLLVLETDADRERFKVKRRFEIRDGERFFADGRQQAQYELAVQQIKRAGNWRVGLRRQILAQLATLGRNAETLRGTSRYSGNQMGGMGGGRVKNLYGDEATRWYGPASGAEPWGMKSVRGPQDFAWDEYGAPDEQSGSLQKSERIMLGVGVNLSASQGESRGGEAFELGSGDEGYDTPDFENTRLPMLVRGRSPYLALKGSRNYYGEGISNGTFVPRWDIDFDGDGQSLEHYRHDSPYFIADDVEYYPESADFSLRRAPRGAHSIGLGLDDAFAADLDVPFDEGNRNGREVMYTIAKPVWETPARRPWELGIMGDVPRGRNWQQYSAWVDALFPAVPPPTRPAAPPKDPTGWPADALALSKSLLRSDALAKLPGGIEIRRTTELFDPHWSRRTGRTGDLVLYGPNAWLTRPIEADGPTIVNYCDAHERGAYSYTTQLGRSRRSQPQDRSTLPFVLADGSLVPLHVAFNQPEVRIEPVGPDRVRLALAWKESEFEQRFLIDTARHVVLMHESFEAGKQYATVTFSDFVEVAGTSWGTKSVSTDDQGRKTAETTLAVTALEPAPYTQRIDDELAPRENVQFLRLPLPSLATARQRVANGSAGFEDRIRMMLHTASIQQWDDLLAQLDAAEKLAAEKPGMPWIRTVILGTVGHNQEARERWLAAAKALAGAPRPDDLYLAGWIADQSRGVMSPAEHLEVLNSLEPVYDRQPEPAAAKVAWHRRVITAFEQLHRWEEALALRRQLAEQLPWDVSQQASYAQALAQRGETDAALAWLRQQIDRPIERLTADDSTLRTAYAELLRAASRWPELLRFTSNWIERNPLDRSAYSQHLAALVYNEQLEAANQLAEQWLREGQVDGRIPPERLHRLWAAISFAQGSAHHLSFQQMDARWNEPLAEAMRFFVARPRHLSLAQSIFNNNAFANSETGDRLRGELLLTLQKDVDRLMPAQVATIVGWTLAGRMTLTEPLEGMPAGRKQLQAGEVPLVVWQRIAARLHDRWAITLDVKEKLPLGTVLETIYSARMADSEYVPFLREQLAVAPPESNVLRTSILFEALLSRPWTAANEQELFDRLGELSDSDEPSQRLSVQVAALYRLVDGMLAGRIAQGQQALRDEGHLDRLTRTELATKNAALRKAAIEGLSAHLALEAARQQAPLRTWLQIEQSYLDVQLNHNLSQVAELCWQITGDAPPKKPSPSGRGLRQAQSSRQGERAPPDDAAKPIDNDIPKSGPHDTVSDDDDLEDSDEVLAQQRSRALDSLLRQRALTTLMNLAARRSAEPALIERVLKYVDAGIAQGGAASAQWRTTKFALLVALDRPDALEADLRVWIRDDVSTATWRQSLARLLAERGKLAEAIQLFEAAQKDQLLTAADHETLAQWYLVRDRRNDYEQARLESFKQMPEPQLRRLVRATARRWNPNGEPREVDESTLLALRALLEKSGHPENYLDIVHSLYAGSRDFRVLAMLPEVVLGRSPQQVYATLTAIDVGVLSELRNEAAADELLAHVKKLRERELSTFDRRALDLIEAMVERRSSEVLDQPGPHVQACLAALRRAFDHAWGSGEPMLMAALLNRLGLLHDPQLAEEQLRELAALAALTKPGSRDHLYITRDWASLLADHYDRRQAALERMEVEVRAYQQAHQGSWPYEDNDVLDTYVGLLSGARRYAAAEGILNALLAKAEHDQQRAWFVDRKRALYNEALEHGGEVSLGKGETLFRNLLKGQLAELQTAGDENARQQLVGHVVRTLDIAWKQHQPNVAAEIRRFVFETLPTVLKRQQSQYAQTAAAPLGLLRDTLGSPAALEYIVERMEHYPQWLQVTSSNAWNTFGGELSSHAPRVAGLDAANLNQRAVALVVAELKRQLQSENGVNLGICQAGNANYWQAETDGFARAANEVYAANNMSGRRAVAVANYLGSGLCRTDRAIEILLIAQSDGVLDEAGRDMLLVFLNNAQRYAETIPLLESVIEARPDLMRYRVMLLQAYFHTKRFEQFDQLLAQTDAHFHQEGRWTEDNIATLAHVVLNCDRQAAAVGNFNEAIALHQRSQAARTGNDAALSRLYQGLASAHSHLQQTRQAVDAASAAIVCWGSREKQRNDAIEQLQQVLEAAHDLDAFVEHLDEEAEQSGQDSPILRKALGQVYQRRNQFALAVAQFRTANELQPIDRQVERALIECFDALNDRAAGTRQLEAWVGWDRQSPDLYRELAGRLADDPAEAERAATSIVESGPREAENFARLAQYRQERDRWDDAITLWAEVAQLKPLEPTGLLRQTEAQLHQQQWDAARRSIEKLEKTTWPERFNVSSEVQSLRAKLPH